MTMTYRGTTALITGASSGLGEEFAIQFASRGADVVLVARRAERLEAVATDLRERFGVTATVLATDLAQTGAGVALKERLDALGITVHTLINNAGFGTHGLFIDGDAEKYASEIQLNVASLVDLTRAFLPELVAAGTGALVNVASTAAYQPTPNMAVYGATKAFVLSFTEAVAYETRGSGLSVLTLSPGATRTEFFDVLGTEAAVVGRYQTSEQVVAVALKALDRKNTPASVVSGAGNRLGAAIATIVPRSLALSITGRILAK